MMEYSDKFPYEATIIIPTYNRSKLLALTLDSILKQTVSQNIIEVIVVDDGSSNDTAEVAKEYSKKMNLKYFFQEDKGFRAGQARNVGILNAQSPICIFIDSGIFLGSRAVEEHIRIHKENERPCAVIGYVYGFDDYARKKDELAQLVDFENPDETIEMLKKHNITDSREYIYQELGDSLSNWPAPWVIFWTCNVSVNRDYLFRVGLFDEYYTSWGGEDTDLAIGLHKLGVKFVLNRSIESLHYPHEQHAPWATGDEAGLAEFERKMKYMHKKYNTHATELWQTTRYDKLNQRLLSVD